MRPVRSTAGRDAPWYEGAGATGFAACGASLGFVVSVVVLGATGPVSPKSTASLFMSQGDGGSAAARQNVAAEAAGSFKSGRAESGRQASASQAKGPIESGLGGPTVQIDASRNLERRVQSSSSRVAGQGSAASTNSTTNTGRPPPEVPDPSAEPNSESSDRPDAMRNANPQGGTWQEKTEDGAPDPGLGQGSVPSGARDGTISSAGMGYRRSRNAGYRSSARTRYRSSAPSVGDDESLYGSSVDSAGTTATGIALHVGPRGGVYHYSASGKKVYQRRR